MKTTVGLARYDLSGYDVVQALIERGIVIEKAGVNTLTLITTFQLGPAAVEATIDGAGRHPRPAACAPTARAAARPPTRSARWTTGR